MAANFNQAVSELSKKLSLKDKRKVSSNLTRIEKPLSRNVRFLDLSNNNINGYKGLSNGLCTSRKIGDSTSNMNINNS